MDHVQLEISHGCFMGVEDMNGLLSHKRWRLSAVIISPMSSTITLDFVEHASHVPLIVLICHIINNIASLGNILNNSKRKRLEARNVSLTSDEITTEMNRHYQITSQKACEILAFSHCSRQRLMPCITTQN